MSNRTLRMAVVDDGQGFSLRHHRRFPAGLGLAVMRQRATLLGGKLLVLSARGRGTTVDLNVLQAHLFSQSADCEALKRKTFLVLRRVVA